MEATRSSETAVETYYPAGSNKYSDCLRINNQQDASSTPKNFGYLMHLVGYLYEDYHDARSLEHKVQGR
jgi:hypothetical protein